MRAPSSSCTEYPNISPARRLARTMRPAAIDTDDRLGRRFQQGNQQLFGLVEDAWDIRRTDRREAGDGWDRRSWQIFPRPGCLIHHVQPGTT